MLNAHALVVAVRDLPAPCLDSSRRRQRVPTSTAVVSEFQQPTAPIPPQDRPDRARRHLNSRKIGAPGVTRTPGTQFRKLLLYPPELRGHADLRDTPSRFYRVVLILC